MKNWIKIPKSNIKIAIVAGIVVFCLALPNLTQAGGLFESLGKEILYTLGEAIHYVLNWVLTAAAAFFEGMLDVGFKQALGVIKIGWQVARDFSNMFFILFLVIVAFATILRIEQYGIRQLLPKVIIIALLINFSFVIAGVIIDFSNIAADFFIKDIRDQIRGRGTISATFADSLGMGALYQTFTDCGEFQTEGYKQCEEYAQAYVNLPSIAPGMQRGEYLALCRGQIDKLVEECNEYGIITVRNESLKEVSFFGLFLSMTVGSAVILIAAFALFAGGVLLLFRMITLWLLVIVVPFVFISYIMPGLRRIWQMWWSTFLKWCFFAPAYAFFVWLAMQISISKANKVLGGMVQNAPSGSHNAATNPFIANPGQQLISYGIIIAFLMGGLIMASKIGIYGAGAALNIAQKAGRGVARWTGVKARERAARPMEAVSAGLAKTIGRVPGFKWLAKAPAAVMKAQRTDIEKEKKNLGVHSIDTLKSLYPALSRTQKIAAAQLMAEKGKLAKGGALKDRDVEKIIKVTNVYGKDLANNLLTNRPDLAPAVGRTKNEIVQKISPAKADKIQTESFKDSETTKLMLRYFRGKHLEKIADASIENANLLQQAIHNLGPDAKTRETALNAINPKLTIYINSAPAQGMGLYSLD